MNPTIILDTGPLGSLTTPKFSPLAANCRRWFQSMVNKGRRIVVPEIADYELRRELLRANKVQGIANLDALIMQIGYLPITTTAMRQAAQFWAQARKQGQPTAGDKTQNNRLRCDTRSPGNYTRRLRFHRCDHKRQTFIALRSRRLMAKHFLRS